MNSKLTRSSRFATASLAGWLTLVAPFFLTAARGAADDDAAQVVKNYLAATYARDFARAYGLISERDKKIISQADFVQSRGAYSSFALRLAEELARGMEFKVIQDARAGERAHIKAAVKLPAPEDLSALVEDWNTTRLNTLPPARQRYILDRIVTLRHEQKLALIESQESFDLIKEGKNWRLFFDWASGARVRFDFRAPPESGIELDFAEREIVARPQEPFLVHFKIKNHGRRAITARIDHRIEPAAARDILEMIQCGLLSPIDLAPGSEREMVGVYILDGPPDIKHLSIAYEFQVSPRRARRNLLQAKEIDFLRPVIFALIALLWTTQARPLSAAESAAESREPNAVVESYLRAIYARDFAAAYNLISTADRKLRDLDRYLRQRGPYNGFALEVARKLGEFTEMRFQSARKSDGRRQITVRYRVPDPQKAAPLALQWDQRRLNSLSSAERHQLIDALDRRGRDGALEMREGEENFELVQENGAWRIFLNWADGVAIPLKLDLSKASELDATLHKDRFVLQPGDVFEVVLKIRNRAKQPVTLRIGHVIDPPSIADYVDFVQCGFLLPITVGPEKEQEFTGTYLIRGSLPDGVRQLSLTYDFRRLQ